MVFSLKADDVMPWGKHIGMTLREIYKNANAYYQHLISEPQKYRISNHTKRILERDLPEKEYSTIPSRCTAPPTFPKLEANTVINGGPFNQKKLIDVAIENPSYYRYLLQSAKYYISPGTIDTISHYIDNCAHEPGSGTATTTISPASSPGSTGSEDDLPAYGHRRSAAEIDKVIRDRIAELEKDIDPERDLQNYIGSRVPTKFSKGCAKTIAENVKADPYHLDAELQRILGSRARFHDGQREAILSVLSGHDTLVVQRTGWGKSLVYFLSVKLLRKMGHGPAIIISPLIALMRDQVSKLPQYGLTGVEITSENKKEWNNIYKDISKGKYDVIFIAPEKLDNFRFMDELKKWSRDVSLFVIDEAHCISDWGHDFRPDFRRISRLVAELPPGTRILATTATANDRVKRDIKYQLSRRKLEIETGCLRRENFYIDVVDLPTDADKVGWLERNLPKLLIYGKGIIYCQTVRNTHQLAEELEDLGFRVKPYNAQLPTDVKHNTVMEFQNGSIDIMIATIAFGMGIDIPDIAFVIHYQQVKGIIEYYQQIGRGGRDPDKTPQMFAITLRGNYDNETNVYFITHGFPAAKDLNETIAYIAENPSCSRQDIMDALDYKQVRADKVLKYLLVDGYIYRKQSRYSLGHKKWECDMRRSRIVSWYRWKEFREFNTFLSSKKCYMKQIREALDEPHTTAIPACGNCSNCRKRHFFE